MQQLFNKSKGLILYIAMTGALNVWGLGTLIYLPSKVTG